jgi:hypothetical protein
MKKVMLIGTIAQLGIGGLGPLLAQRASVVLSTADIAAKVTPGTATVIAIGERGDTIGQGSAFIVRDDGVLVTNFHVLRGATAALVILSSREQFSRVRVLEADSAVDLVLLKIPGAGLPVIPTRTSVPRVGERAIAIGSPLGLSSTVSEGIVSAVRVAGGKELVQITAPISPGSSGGVVVDTEGRAFAVTTSYLSEGQSLNFAVPVRYALGLLNDRPGNQSIAEVFRVLASPDAPRATTLASRPDSVPAGLRRARTPRPDVSGSYEVSEEWSDTSGRVLSTSVGYLFATSNVGFLVLAQRDSQTLGKTYVLPVDRWATNANGDLVLDAGLTYDGYQSDNDSFVLGATSQERGKPPVNVWLGGVPVRLPLSRSDGLYVATSRTYYESNGRRLDDPSDWSGEVAVAFAAGTIYVDLYLTNERGGTTSFYASGPLNGDAFTLKERKGSTLVGTLRNGVLRAQWRDQRDGGAAFVGTLRADRK